MSTETRCILVLDALLIWRVRAKTLNVELSVEQSNLKVILVHSHDKEVTCHPRLQDLVRYIEASNSFDRNVDLLCSSRVADHTCVSDDCEED